MHSVPPTFSLFLDVLPIADKLNEYSFHCPAVRQQYIRDTVYSLKYTYTDVYKSQVIRNTKPIILSSFQISLEEVRDYPMVLFPVLFSKFQVLFFLRHSSVINPTLAQIHRTPSPSRGSPAHVVTINGIVPHAQCLHGEEGQLIKMQTLHFIFSSFPYQSTSFLQTSKSIDLRILY